MGCENNNKLNEIEENHKLDIIPISEKLSKNEKIDLLENNNQHIMNCSDFFEGQIPDQKTDRDYNDKLFNRENLPPELEEQLEIDNSNFEWKSAKEIFGKKVKIFGDTTSIKDIKLGSANNSYFISAISSLSEFPNIILQLFRTVTLPKEGELIEVCIRIEGKWTVVCVDDKFMVNKETNIPIFSTSPTKNIWGMILEKAWAKVSGGYENIIYGNSIEIFEAFTPFRTIEINLKKIENESFSKYINSSFDHNCMMTGITKENMGDFESIGFISVYSFSLLGYKETEKNKKKDIIRTIKLRNPLGDNEALNNKINEDLVEELGILSIEDNGIFLMEYNSFLKCFSSITLCIPTAVLYSYLINIPVEKASDFGTIRILIEEETNLSISIISLSFRFHNGIQPDEDIFKNLILIQIFREKQKANYITSSLNEALFTNVKPGEYICIYNVDYNEDVIKDIQPFNINVSCTKPFKYCLDEPDNDYSLLKHIMIPKIESIEKYEKKMKDDFVLFTGNKFELTSFAFYYMKNQFKETKYVKPSVYLRNFKSIEGKFPICLKMNRNDLFFFLFNRIKSKSVYQTGANVGFFKSEVPEAVTPKSYIKLPEKYCKEVEYVEKKYDFELSLMSKKNENEKI